MPRSESQVVYTSTLAQISSRLKPDSCLLIYDQVLEGVCADWIKRFPMRLAVESGESLKTIESFTAFCESVSRSGFDLPARSMTVVALGGGSVGDFAGFFASVYKRGVRLVQVPTTWLAAIDSAHGGKTALNVGGAKNQIGTFYPASQAFIARDVLASSPVDDAMGELAKIAMIDGRPWVRALESSRLFGVELMWKFLKPAVDSKMRIVKRDPREEKGLRQVLNLGHTLGHVIESSMGLSHGASIAQGLFFALEYSRSRKKLSSAHFERAMSLMGLLGLAPMPRAIPVAELRNALMSDKKRASVGKLTFIFLRAFGRCERRDIGVDDLVKEAVRQGWAR